MRYPDWLGPTWASVKQLRIYRFFRVLLAYFVYVSRFLSFPSVPFSNCCAGISGVRFFLCTVLAHTALLVDLFGRPVLFYYFYPNVILYSNIFIIRSFFWRFKIALSVHINFFGHPLMTTCPLIRTPSLIFVSEVYISNPT